MHRKMGDGINALKEAWSNEENKSVIIQNMDLATI